MTDRSFPSRPPEAAARRGPPDRTAEGGRAAGKNGVYGPTQGLRTVKVTVGDHAVDSAEDVILTTTLGSCVSAAIFDLEKGLGGINHFLLPEAPSGDGGAAARYGVGAMERLINAVLRAGGQRSRLVAKLFGGGRVIQSSFDVGGRNAAFALSYLEREGIPVIGQDLGGDRGRRILVYPSSGRVLRRLLEPTVLTQTVREEERFRRALKDRPPVAGDIELFE